MNTAEHIFGALSDRLRLRCVLLLANAGELCVCEITHALDVVQPKVSRHLATLRAAGIVTAQRDAQRLYYRLNPDCAKPVSRILEAACAVSAQDADHLADLQRLAGNTKRVVRLKPPTGASNTEDTHSYS
mgnify:CR=1 FL=1